MLFSKLSLRNSIFGENRKFCNDLKHHVHKKRMIDDSVSLRHYSKSVDCVRRSIVYKVPCVSQ